MNTGVVQHEKGLSQKLWDSCLTSYCAHKLGLMFGRNR